MTYIRGMLKSIVFSKTAKGIYLGISLFISPLLFRQIGPSKHWIWYILIILNFIFMIFISRNMNKTE
jgi:hypothetical protein